MYLCMCYLCTFGFGNPPQFWSLLLSKFVHLGFGALWMLRKVFSSSCSVTKFGTQNTVWGAFSSLKESNILCDVSFLTTFCFDLGKKVVSFRFDWSAAAGAARRLTEILAPKFKRLYWQVDNILSCSRHHFMNLQKHEFFASMHFYRKGQSQFRMICLWVKKILNLWNCETISDYEAGMSQGLKIWEGEQ